MFDIGFFELLVIAVVGLVVIGPERLPGAVRSGALWWGRFKRSIQETRSELEKQLGADEIRRELHNEDVMRSLEALRLSRQDLERQVDATNETEATEHSQPPHSTDTFETDTNATHDSDAPDVAQSTGSETRKGKSHD